MNAPLTNPTITSGSGPDPNQLSFDEVLNNLPAPQTSTSLAASGTASEQQVNQIISGILKAKNLPENNTNRNSVLVAICELVQIGATSPKFAESRTNSYGTITISVGELKKQCKTFNTTTRKVARHLQEQAIKVAEKFDLPGNLSKTFLIEKPDASREELYWASDFQTFTNSDRIPDSVRTFLLKNYQKRFTNINTTK